MELTKEKFKYDKIIPFAHAQKDFTVAVANGKSGLINFDGKQITEFIYDDMSNEFDDESYYDVGWVHFENRNDEYCRMRLNGKWGLLDGKGNVIVDCKFSNPVQEWGEKFIIGEGNDNSYVEYPMDKDGNIHYELAFDRIIPHSDFAIVVKNEKYGIIDNNFETIIDFKYDRLYTCYNEKFICVQIGDKWGIIDIQENILLDLIYDDVEIEKYDNKYIFKVKYSNKYALFNEKGEIIS